MGEKRGPGFLGRLGGMLAGALEVLPPWAQLVAVVFLSVFGLFVALPFAMTTSAAVGAALVAAVEQGRSPTFFGVGVGEREHPTVARCKLVINDTGHVFVALNTQITRANDLLQRYVEATAKARHDLASFVSSAKQGEDRVYRSDFALQWYEHNLTNSVHEQAEAQTKIVDFL